MDSAVLPPSPKSGVAGAQRLTDGAFSSTAHPIDLSSNHVGKCGMTDPSPTKPTPWLAPFRAVARVIVTIGVIAYTALDELLFPLFRPAIRWLGGLRIFQQLGGWIKGLPPYLVLALLAAPFIILEPAKLFAIYWSAVGHPVQGVLLLLAAQVASILTCDRFFHVGYEPLMRIGWFNRLMTWVIGLRDAVLGWGKSTGIWKASTAFAHGIGDWFRGLMAGLK